MVGPWALDIPGLPAHVEQPGLRLQVHADTDLYISTAIREQGLWEPFETQLLTQMLRPGDVFVDAGANIGYFTVIAAAAVGPTGAVYAFEPEPRNSALLQKNVELNELSDWTHVYGAALGAQAGLASLYLHPDNLGDHQLHPDHDGRVAVDVQVMRGSEVIGEAQQRVDFVKVDTQGSEQLVIEGLMPLLLHSGAGLRLLLELTPYSLRKAGTTGAQLIACLQQLALPFNIVDHLEHALVPVSADELVQWCNNVDAEVEDQGFMNIFVGSPV